MDVDCSAVNFGGEESPGSPRPKLAQTGTCSEVYIAEAAVGQEGDPFRDCSEMSVNYPSVLPEA